ncbi:MAG: pyrroline-5-carboxylate reductase [Bacteroidales bacterium]|nr:pyrroline-5-carboxylate reductase [Bacteroidales bacterium]
MKVAIIGAGNMGGAIARGLAAGTIVRAADMTVTAHTQQTIDRLKADVPGIRTTLDNRQAAAGAQIVILAIKPWLVENIIGEIAPELAASHPLIISVAAGISFEQLTGILEANGAGPFDLEDNQLPLVRVIPNTAIAIRKSPTLISFDQHVSDAQKKLVQDMFNELGTSIVIEERLMAAGTAVTSCGIAYAFEYIKAAIQGAIELGFYPHVAKAMIDQTVLGAVGLLEQNGTYPDAEIYKVCTPGGITIKGLNEMTKEGFDHAVIAGLKKAAGK